MFAGKDAPNAAYPTQWALNPSAYQNVDSSEVDWAALAQQWIAMKEAAAIVGVPQPKIDTEEGEAPMEVEITDNNSEVPVPPAPEWNAPPNNWGGSWNQWGWGWSGAAPIDSKVAPDPSAVVPPVIDGYPVTENSSSLPGYTTGAVPQPTFQHGYWTAPQAESVTNSRSNNRSIDRRSKSKNRDNKPARIRVHRDKPPMIPPVMDPVVMATPVLTPTIDAAKRRQLPAWIREGLEKMEREKQKAIEREQEKKAREEAELEKKKLEEEELARIKAEATGEPMIPAKSKFETDSEGEESDKEDKAEDISEEVTQTHATIEPAPEINDPPPLVKKSKEEIMQEVMLAVRRSLTEILLEVTDQEIHTVSQEELARYNAAQASRLNAMKASKSKALAAIATGLGAYESSDESEEEPTDLSDHQLQEIIKRKRLEFERTSREIEADVRRAEMRESLDDNASPVSTTPDRPRQPRSSVTPPPADNDTPERKSEHRNMREKRLYKIDENRKLDIILEEKSKKSNKYEGTPSPQRADNKSNSKESVNSSSSDAEDDSSSSSSDSSSEINSKVESSRSKKKKHRSSSSTESQKKTKKQRREKDIKPIEKSYKSKHEERDRTDKPRKKRDSHNDKHKSSRNRDYERSHRDRHRDDSDDDRPKKRSKRSRSISYESRSGRRKHSRDRSEDRSRRREKKSYDRDSSKRDRSYDRSARDYDRYERSRDYERRRSRSGSHRRRR